MVSKSAQQRGFTLGELLIAVAVVGISLSIAVPSFTTIMNNNRRTTSINQFVSTMHQARSEAVTRNAQITVCPSKDGDDCESVEWNDGWMFFVDTDRDRSVDGGEAILGTVAASTKLDIHSSEFDDFFVYRPNGRVMVATPAANTGQMTFCDPRGADFARVVIVSFSGQPRVSDYQSDGSDPSCP